MGLLFRDETDRKARGTVDGPNLWVNSGRERAVMGAIGQVILLWDHCDFFRNTNFWVLVSLFCRAFVEF